jgi:hypothetical protein
VSTTLGLAAIDGPLLVTAMWYVNVWPGAMDGDPTTALVIARSALAPATVPPGRPLSVLLLFVRSGSGVVEVTEAVFVMSEPLPW